MNLNFSVFGFSLNVFFTVYIGYCALNGDVRQGIHFCGRVRDLVLMEKCFKVEI